jgi:hypothetical protein
MDRVNSRVGVGLADHVCMAECSDFDSAAQVAHTAPGQKLVHACPTATLPGDLGQILDYVKSLQSWLSVYKESHGLVLS